MLWPSQEGRLRARQSGPCSPGSSGWPRKLALGTYCLAKLGTHIDRDGAHEVHVRHAVSIEEEDAGLRSVIAADAEYGPAGLGDAHISFRDLRGRDGWPGRLPTAGRIGLQPGWLSATSERICSGRLSPGRTGTDQEADLSQRGAPDAAAQEVPPSKLLVAWRRFPRAGQLPKQLLRGHKLACHASPHVAEDGSWTCPTCGDCFDDSAIDQ